MMKVRLRGLLYAPQMHLFFFFYFIYNHAECCTLTSRLLHMKARAICTIAAPNAPAIEGGRNENLLDIVGGAASLVGRSVSESARAAKFWSTVLAIWGRYKVTQVRTRAALGRGNTAAAERLWKHRHAHEADVIWRLCVDMRVCTQVITDSFFFLSNLVHIYQGFLCESRYALKYIYVYIFILTFMLSLQAN